MGLISWEYSGKNNKKLYYNLNTAACKNMQNHQTL